MCRSRINNALPPDIPGNPCIADTSGWSAFFWSLYRGIPTNRKLQTAATAPCAILQMVNPELDCIFYLPVNDLSTFPGFPAGPAMDRSTHPWWICKTIWSTVAKIIKTTIPARLARRRNALRSRNYRFGRGWPRCHRRQRHRVDKAAGNRRRYKGNECSKELSGPSHETGLAQK